MTVQAYLNENPSAIMDIKSINSIFESFGLSVNEVIKGAQIIRYKLNLPLDLKIQGKIRRAEKDIEYALTSALKSDEIIYGKSEDYVFVERKADKFNVVDAKKILMHRPEKGLLLLLGTDLNGKPCYTDLRKAPHVLVAGTTGSGKSEVLHTFIGSLISRRRQNHCWIHIIDPKRAEYSMYENRNGITLITDMTKAVEQLERCCMLMESRYEKLKKAGVKDISELNNPDIYPHVIIIDELKDLLMQDKRAEQYIVRLAQKARACGIHLILGTQSPRADVITGLIKCNIPTKIALHTTNQMESRIILDQNGAEHLFGQGDMLFLGNGKFKPIRIQSAYLNNAEKLELANALAIDNQNPLQPKAQPNVTPQPTPTTSTPIYQPKKKKRVGFIQGMINLMRVKPIMFESDDYPPKI